MAFNLRHAIGLNKDLPDYSAENKGRILVVSDTGEMYVDWDERIKITDPNKQDKFAEVVRAKNKPVQILIDGATNDKGDDLGFILRPSIYSQNYIKSDTDGFSIQSEYLKLKALTQLQIETPGFILDSNPGGTIIHATDGDYFTLLSNVQMGIVSPYLQFIDNQITFNNSTMDFTGLKSLSVTDLHEVSLDTNDIFHLFKSSSSKIKGDPFNRVVTKSDINKVGPSNYYAFGNMYFNSFEYNYMETSDYGEIQSIGRLFDFNKEYFIIHCSNIPKVEVEGSVGCIVMEDIESIVFPAEYEDYIKERIPNLYGIEFGKTYSRINLQIDIDDNNNTISVINLDEYEKEQSKLKWSTF